MASDRDQPVIEIHTGDELLEASEGQTRFMMFLLGVFSATAFILAVIGIYGVIAYSVAQRTNELGIRMALGAARADILRLVIGSGLLTDRDRDRDRACGICGGDAAARIVAVSNQPDRSADFHCERDSVYPGRRRRELHPGAARHAHRPDRRFAGGVAPPMAVARPNSSAPHAITKHAWNASLSRN